MSKNRFRNYENRERKDIKTHTEIGYQIWNNCGFRNILKHFCAYIKFVWRDIQKQPAKFNLFFTNVQNNCRPRRHVVLVTLLSALNRFYTLFCSTVDFEQINT